MIKAVLLPGVHTSIYCALSSIMNLKNFTLTDGLRVHLRQINLSPDKTEQQRLEQHPQHSHHIFHGRLKHNEMGYIIEWYTTSKVKVHKHSCNVHKN